ncbi:MAG: DNA polymerase ligase N-terminal domain-containing protein [Pirellulaceae bacterium]
MTTTSRRFVILRHETPSGYSKPSHYDLMIQWGEILRTWTLAYWPEIGTEVKAVPDADHRLAYLDYEGEVSQGRGFVEREDEGICEWLAESPERIHLRLSGRVLQGDLTLVVYSDSGSESDSTSGST